MVAHRVVERSIDLEVLVEEIKSISVAVGHKKTSHIRSPRVITMGLVPFAFRESMARFHIGYNHVLSSSTSPHRLDIWGSAIAIMPRRIVVGYLAWDEIHALAVGFPPCCQNFRAVIVEECGRLTSRRESKRRYTQGYLRFHYILAVDIGGSQIVSVRNHYVGKRSAGVGLYNPFDIYFLGCRFA